MMRELAPAALALLLILATPRAPGAQGPKLGYIDSAKILSEYGPYLEAQKELDRFRKEKEEEAQKREREIQDLLSKYENQKLLLSEKKRKELEEEIARKREEYRDFVKRVFEPGGEIYEKNRELSEPVYREINEVIRRIGEEGGYDFIFDVVPMSVVHADRKYDLTRRVMDELAKKAKTKRGEVKDES